MMNSGIEIRQLVILASDFCRYRRAGLYTGESDNGLGVVCVNCSTD